MKKKGLKLLVLLIVFTLSITNIAFANDNMIHDHHSSHEHDLNDTDITIMAIMCNCGSRMSLIDKEEGGMGGL